MWLIIIRYFLFGLVLIIQKPGETQGYWRFKVKPDFQKKIMPTKSKIKILGVKGLNYRIYKVRQQRVNRVLLTLFMPHRFPNKTGFGTFSQASKFAEVEFQLWSQQNHAHELLPHHVKIQFFP